MVDFKSIKSAIHYVRHCPFCNKDLFINQKDASIVFIGKKPHIRFNLMGEDTFNLNIVTGEILAELRNTISTYGYFRYGTTYHKVNLQCSNADCGLYDFTIQIQIDLDENKTKDILLNSERISFEDKFGELHEVKNVYTQGVTEYTFYPEGEAKTEKVPLVKFDFSEPERTIERIKKLILFS